MISSTLAATAALLGLGSLATSLWVFRKCLAIINTANAAMRTHDAVAARLPAEEIRIRLDDAEFRDLVAGKEIVCRDLEGTRVRMILADIGWDRMEQHIFNASREKST